MHILQLLTHLLRLFQPLEDAAATLRASSTTPAIVRTALDRLPAVCETCTLWLGELQWEGLQEASTLQAMRTAQSRPNSLQESVVRTRFPRLHGTRVQVAQAEAALDRRMQQLLTQAQAALPGYELDWQVRGLGRGGPVTSGPALRVRGGGGRVVAAEILGEDWVLVKATKHQREFKHTETDQLHQVRHADRPLLVTPVHPTSTPCTAI